MTQHSSRASEGSKKDEKGNGKGKWPGKEAKGTEWEAEQEEGPAQSKGETKEGAGQEEGQQQL